MIEYDFDKPTTFSASDWEKITDPWFDYCITFKFGGRINAAQGVYGVFEGVEPELTQVMAGLTIEDSNTVKVLYNEKIEGVFVANFI